MTCTPFIRILRTCAPRILYKLAFNFAWKAGKNISSFTRRVRRKEDFFPAFMMISLTNRCQLACRGCWVTPTPPTDLSSEQLNGVIASCKARGAYFFGLLGGEPLLYPDLFAVLAQHPDCYFQLFTNGLALDRDLTRRLRELGNVTPLISIEGRERENAARRGRDDVFAAATAAMANCQAEKLFFGVASSIGRENFAELVSDEFLQYLAAAGAHYLWYYIYRPTGKNPSPTSALTAAEILRLREFIVKARLTAPLLLIDAYWDNAGRALCPAATGLSLHLNANGAVEFCPPLQFARDYLNARGDNFAEICAHSSFIADLRQFVAAQSRGCPLLENPGALLEFMQNHQAGDSSGRGTIFAELANLSPCASHHQVGQEIPEKSFLYRLAKKFYFFGFGAYG